MINSMTGFGKCETSTDSYDFSVEIKSVNARHIDINIKLPGIFSQYEIELRKLIKEKLSRGTISVYLSVTKKPEASTIKKISENTAKLYADNLKNLAEKLGINKDFGYEVLFRFDDIFEKETDEEDYLPVLKDIFTKALDKLKAYRAEEGAALKSDLLDRVQVLEKLTEEAEIHSKDAAKIQFERLLERINKNYTKEISIENERLEQELTLISDKVDISEEITRLKSHFEIFRTTLENGEELPVGQKLNFLAQELHREANTMAAKTNLTEISHLSVKMREIIEKIREQVQNIE